MEGRCCRGGRFSGRLARRLCGAAASLAPGAALVLLPKCPLCLAAWIAACTGVGVPAIVAGSVRPVLVFACVTTILLLLRRGVVRLRWDRRMGG